MDTMKQEWVEFWKKLARLIDSGIPLLSTCELIRNETNQLVIKETCRALIDELKGGNTFSGAMERLPALFPPSMVKIIRVGEMTGRVDTAALSVAAGIEEGSFKPGSADPVAAAGKTESRDPVSVAGAEPLIKYVTLVLQTAVRDKASDIHIESGPERVRLRCRIEGVLHEMAPPPQELGAVIINRFKIMADMNLADRRLPQDGRIQISIDDQLIDMRVTSVPIVEGESLVIRILTGRRAVPTLEQIFKPDHLTTVLRWLNWPNGLVIASGPTGSGKTTTLYSLLKSFDATRYKIMTVEDPVEYRLEGICQQRVNAAIGQTFPAALRCTFRQAPDIVMAGEVRDLETIQCLFQLALTGHFVLTALHASSGVTTMKRLVDLGLEPYMVSSFPVGVVSQRLCRQICQSCKAEIKPEPWMRDFFPQGALPKLYKGKGCDQCHGTGYRGREAIHELFEPSGEFIHKLAGAASVADLQAEAGRGGLVTLRAEGLAKVAAGITTLEEILPITASSK